MTDHQELLFKLAEIRELLQRLLEMESNERE